MAHSNPFLFSPRDRNSGVSNPFEGTPYADMWSNNPYKDLYYEPSFWDNIGLSNKAKDVNAEYDRLYNEYISGIYQQQYQDSYNSPANQAKLEKQAGLNPDLTGISGVGSASEFTPPNAGANPALNGVSPSSTALSTFTNILSFATSTFSQIQQIRGLMFDNEQKDISSFQAFTEAARPHIVAEYARRFTGSNANNWSDVADVASKSFTSRRNQRRFQDAFSSLLSSSQFTSARQAYEDLNANDKAMQHFITGMVKYSVEAEKHGYIAQRQKSEYDTRFYGNLSPEDSASAQNRENQNRGWLDKWRNDFYKTLYSDFKNGSHLAGLLLIGANSKFNAVALGLLHEDDKTWLDAGINWNDSVAEGIAKRLSLF